MRAKKNRSRGRGLLDEIWQHGPEQPGRLRVRFGDVSQGLAISLDLDKLGFCCGEVWELSEIRVSQQLITARANGGPFDFRRRYGKWNFGYVIAGQIRHVRSLAENNGFGQRQPGDQIPKVEQPTIAHTHSVNAHGGVINVWNENAHDNIAVCIDIDRRGHVSKRRSVLQNSSGLIAIPHQRFVDYFGCAVAVPLDVEPEHLRMNIDVKRHFEMHVHIGAGAQVGGDEITLRRCTIDAASPVDVSLQNVATNRAQGAWIPFYILLASPFVELRQRRGHGRIDSANFSIDRRGQVVGR